MRPYLVARLAGSGLRADQLKHYDLRTKQAYVGWIKRHIAFHDKRHPLKMGKAEAFLGVRAVTHNAGSTTSIQPPATHR